MLGASPCQLCQHLNGYSKLMTFLTLLVFALIPIALYTGTVANVKEYKFSYWTIGGFLFFPVVLLAVVGLPDLKQRKFLRYLADSKGYLDK